MMRKMSILYNMIPFYIMSNDKLDTPNEGQLLFISKKIHRCMNKIHELETKRDALVYSSRLPNISYKKSDVIDRRTQIEHITHDLDYQLKKAEFLSYYYTTLLKKSSNKEKSPEQKTKLTQESISTTNTLNKKDRNSALALIQRANKKVESGFKYNMRESTIAKYGISKHKDGTYYLND